MEKKNFSAECIYKLLREIKALRQENRELKQHVKTLKKAVALFVK
ncbi:hypothetical protein [Siminovitchia fortis]|nr:hypothetical protein [Siminovitchia fortis]